MDKTVENKLKKRICIGLLAHVDAGKTTLAEALLYKTGTIRKPGRVDHKNAFLDTDVQERDRGITIFSKQAEMVCEDMRIMLLDTPGHVDFSAEMERTLQVLDYAVLVINGKDGVQGHTVTLWKLLKKYQVPVFLFVNKMDLEGTDKETVLSELKNSLNDGCVDFSGNDGCVDFSGNDGCVDFSGNDGCVDFSRKQDVQWMEQVAMCDEGLLEELLEKEVLDPHTVAAAVKNRKIFPCYFGSALKMEGIKEFLDGIYYFTEEKEYPRELGAKVYKITRDKDGSRLTHMKITGGALHPKDVLATGKTKGQSTSGKEKVEQIRIYSGEKFRSEDCVRGGDICAVTGLKNTYAGQGLGEEPPAKEPLLESVLLYKVEIPSEYNTHDAFMKLKQLEEEDPQLHVIWNEKKQNIQMQLMGEVQIEILQNIIKQRFGFPASFGQGEITYKETIAEPVFGAGHFEPLRHYAEVQLLLEPGERGSGLTFDSMCSEDVLDRNWQRLILTHLSEKEHLGVLTGSPVTDLKITLLTGKAHLKHTEGGDFRQATYRAVRQGLRKAKSVLLEPWYEFRLEVPGEMMGRAMSDIQKMGGSCGESERGEEKVVLTGKAPVSQMKDYALTVTSYTKGYGHLSCSLCGYEPCHNQEEIVAALGYDPDSDIENTADSVFCRQGAGVNVKWDQVDPLLHLDGSKNLPADLLTKELSEELGENGRAAEKPILTAKTGQTVKASYGGSSEEEKELVQIFEKAYGVQKPQKVIEKKKIVPQTDKVTIKPQKISDEYLLVDGYNIIFAWKQLKELAAVNMDSARQALIEILSNYQGYRKCKVIVVFDAYKVEGGEGRCEKHGNIDVIYTKEAETADMYIEKTAYKMGKDYHVRVATSDRLEQMIIFGSGAFKVSADEFRLEIENTEAKISAFIQKHNERNKQKNRNRIKLQDQDVEI